MSNKIKPNNRYRQVDPNAIRGLTNEQRGKEAVKEYKMMLEHIYQKYNCSLAVIRDIEQEKQVLSGLNWRMRLFNWLVGVKYNSIYKIAFDALPYPTGNQPVEENHPPISDKT